MKRSNKSPTISTLPAFVYLATKMTFDEGKEGRGSEQRVTPSLMHGSQSLHLKNVSEGIQTAMHPLNCRHHELPVTRAPTGLVHIKHRDNRDCQ